MNYQTQMDAKNFIQFGFYGQIFTNTTATDRLLR